MIDLNIKDEWGGIDEKIKPLVFELNRLKIPTSGSCEGHVDHGFPGPWVSIYVPEEKTRVGTLLNEFYSNRDTNPDIRLSLMDGHGGFWIYSGGEKFLKFREEINAYAEKKAADENPQSKTISEEEKTTRQKTLLIQQTEILDFANFLKTKQPQLNNTSILLKLSRANASDGFN